MNTNSNMQMQADGQNFSKQNASAQVSVKADSSAVTQIAAALVLGAVMIFGVGFANMGVAHNAAHDARHAFAFPCH